MIDVSTDVSLTNAKKLVQSKISSYFKGSRGIPIENSEKKTQKQKRRMTSSTSNREKTVLTQTPQSSRIRHDSSISSESSSTTKRKLVAQIFSEDEDSDSENAYGENTLIQRKENSSTVTPSRRPVTLISLNKPSPLKKSPKKILVDWRLHYTSTPAGVSSGEILSTSLVNNVDTNLHRDGQVLQCKKANMELRKNNFPVSRSRFDNYSDSDSDESDANVVNSKKIRTFRSKTPIKSSSNNNCENKNIDPCCSKALTDNCLSRSATPNKSSEKPKEKKNSVMKNIKSTTQQKVNPGSLSNSNFENKNIDPCCSKTLTNDCLSRSATPNNSLEKPKEKKNVVKKNFKNTTQQNVDLRSSKAFVDNDQSRVRMKNKNSQNDDSDEPDENSNISKKPKIKILNDIVINPSKDTLKKNKSLPKPVSMKDEDKKLNFYYLDVMKDFFFNVVNTVSLKCLLTNDHREMLEKFFNTDRNYQYTCVKLFMWKPSWYNIFKYTEKIGLKMTDSEVIAMFNHLKSNAFVDTNYLVEDLFTLLDLLSLKDLREVQRSFKITHTINTRDAIISRLIKNCKTQVTLTCTKSTEQVLRERIEKKLGFCFKLSKEFNEALSNVYLLNTFTNSTLTKPQEYFRNVNDVVFPSYKMESYNIFYTPEEFSRYATATRLRNALDEAIEKKNNGVIYEICRCVHRILRKIDDGNSFDPSRDPHLEKFTARAQYISILSSGVKYITSTAHDEARIWLEYLLSQKYCNFKRGNWYYHLSMIYTAYLKEYETAAKLLITAFENDKEHLSEVQLHELAFRGKILDRKTYNLPTLFHDQIAALSPTSCEREWPQCVIESRTVRSNEPGRKRKYVQECSNGDINYLTVEQTAIEHYRMSGYPDGEHCEGGLVCAAFCLLFWDIIYESYVRGTFVSKVQNAPLDMYTKYFFLNRENLIKTRLYNIRSGWKEAELKKFFNEKWDSHSHESCLCPIDTIVTDTERLFSVILCIGRSILSQIFERLVKNFKVYHSGFPDLIVWNFSLKKAKFVEVKGENDTLSIKQKLWINYLLDIGADVEVCHVHSTGSKKKIIKGPKKC